MVVTELKEKAQYIYDRFIRAGAMYEIDVPPQSREAIRAAISTGNMTASLFEQAQKYALNTIFVDVFPKFKGIKRTSRTVPVEMSACMAYSCLLAHPVWQSMRKAARNGPALVRIASVPPLLASRSTDH